MLQYKLALSKRMGDFPKCAKGPRDLQSRLRAAEMSVIIAVTPLCGRVYLRLRNIGVTIAYVRVVGMFYRLPLFSVTYIHT